MLKNSQNFSMQEALRLANSDAGQRLLAGEIIDGTSSHDDHGAPGGLPEKFPVRGKGNGLGAAAANAPVIIYRNN